MLRGKTISQFKPSIGDRILYGVIFTAIGLSFVCVALLIFLIQAHFITLFSMTADVLSDFTTVKSLALLFMGIVPLWFGVPYLVGWLSGRPVLTVREDGIERLTGFGRAYWAHWSSISPFEIVTISGGRGYSRQAKARITGTNANVAWFFVLDNMWNQKSDFADLVELINQSREKYLLAHPEEQAPSQ